MFFMATLSQSQQGLELFVAVFQCDIQSNKPVFVLPAPSPTTAVHYLATKCVDTAKHRQGTKWFMPWGPNQCDKIRSFDEAMAKRIEANNIVFAVHIPLPNKEMSPWFQFMLVILQFDIAFKMYNQIGENRGFYDDSLQDGDCRVYVSPSGQEGEGRRPYLMRSFLLQAYRVCET